VNDGGNSGSLGGRCQALASEHLLPLPGPDRRRATLAGTDGFWPTLADVGRY
jgi:hypothetical protein